MLSVPSSASLSWSSFDTGEDDSDGLPRETFQWPCGVETFRRLKQMSSALDLLELLTSSLLPSSSSSRGSIDVIKLTEVKVEGGELDLCRFIVW